MQVIAKNNELKVIECNLTVLIWCQYNILSGISEDKMTMTKPYCPLFKFR